MESELSLGVTITFILFMIVILVENIFLYYLVYKFKRLRTHTNFFILSLSFSDILFAGTFMPVYIINPYEEVNEYLTCIVLYAGVANTVCVSCERYFAIKKPLEYRDFVAKHSLKMIISSWAIPIIYSLLPLTFGTNKLAYTVYVAVLLLFGTVVPFIVIVWIYSKIFLEVKSRVKRMSNIGGTVHLGGQRNQAHNNRNNCRRKTSRKRLNDEWRVARIFILIAFLFFISWTPVIWLTTCFLFQAVSLMPEELFLASVFTLIASSVANGLIYALFKPDFKRFAMVVLGCNKSKHSRDNSGTYSRATVVGRIQSIATPTAHKFQSTNSQRSQTGSCISQEVETENIATDTSPCTFTPGRLENSKCSLATEVFSIEMSSDEGVVEDKE